MADGDEKNTTSGGPRKLLLPAAPGQAQPLTHVGARFRKKLDASLSRRKDTALPAPRARWWAWPGQNCRVADARVEGHVRKGLGEGPDQGERSRAALLAGRHTFYTLLRYRYSHFHPAVLPLKTLSAEK